MSYKNGVYRAMQELEACGCKPNVIFTSEQNELFCGTHGDKKRIKFGEYEIDVFINENVPEGRWFFIDTNNVSPNLSEFFNLERFGSDGTGA